MKEMQNATFKKKGSYAKEEVPNYKNNFGQTVKFPRMSLKFENVQFEITEAYLEPWQKPMMKRFCENRYLTCFQPLTIFT